MSNAPATFQRFMNDIFADLLRKGVVIYLDDIFIYTKTREEHTKLVREVLKRLHDNDLFLKPEKCSFYQIEVEYLGHLISKGQVKMDPAKVQAIVDWPTPQKVKDIQKFVGFANFYRRFIDNFSDIA